MRPSLDNYSTSTLKNILLSLDAITPSCEDGRYYLKLEGMTWAVGPTPESCLAFARRTIEAIINRRKTFVKNPCKICNNTGWVCETHEDKPMDHDPECHAPGAPCQLCNSGRTHDNPPDTSRVFTSVTHVKGKVVQ